MNVSKRVPEPLGIPRGIALWAEKIGSHVVVDPVHLPFAIGKKRNNLAADQTTRAGDQNFFHDDSFQLGYNDAKRTLYSNVIIYVSDSSL